MRGSTGRRAGLAALLTGTAVAAAVLAPVSAQAAGTTVVRGVVTAGGRPLAGVAVGTWSAARGVVTQGTTDARGRFELHSPAGIALEAWAGAKPSSSHAVFAAGDRHLVRGVVGDTQPKGLTSPLWQRAAQVVPARLGHGGVVRFRLQTAGRFTSPVSEGGTGRIALQHGTGYGPWFHAKDGTITSGWLVPGTYTVYVDPKPGRLAARTRVTVSSGTTALPASTLPATPVGTTVRIHATSGGAALPEGVPVIEQRTQGEGTVPPTDSSGTATAEDVTPGVHRYTVGKAFDDPDEGYAGQPTSDDWLPATVEVDVAAGQATADATVDLARASKISGTVTVRNGAAARVVAEDADGRIVRVGYPDATGAFVLGGLRSGSYSVLAEDQDAHVYDRIAVTLTPGTTTSLARPLTPSIADPVLRGTVHGARAGSVSAQARAYGAVIAGERDDFGASGAYRITLLPGRYALVIDAAGHAVHTAATLLVDGASTTRDLRVGPALARAVVRFAVRGHLVRPGYAALTDDGGDLVLVARTNDGGMASDEVAPGTYAWTPAFSLPAVDGPWTFSRPSGGAFTLHAGERRDLGTLKVTIRG